MAPRGPVAPAVLPPVSCPRLTAEKKTGGKDRRRYGYGGMATALRTNIFSRLRLNRRCLAL